MRHLRVVTVQRQRNGRQVFLRIAQKNVEHIGPFLFLIRQDIRFLHGDDVSLPLLVGLEANHMPTLAEFHIGQIPVAQLHEAGFQEGAQKEQRPHQRAKQHDHRLHNKLRPVVPLRLEQQKPEQIDRDHHKIHKEQGKKPQVGHSSHSSITRVRTPSFSISCCMSAPAAWSVQESSTYRLPSSSSPM